MPNLSALKEKLAGFHAQLLEKTDKIGFIRAWREKHAVKAPSSPTAADGKKATESPTLRRIYSEGSTGTRLQVIAFYLFVVVSLASAGSVARKMVAKLRSSTEHEQVGHDISHGLAEAKRKAEEKAQLLSLGQFTANVYTGPAGEGKMMSVDLWIRVSDPETASKVNTRNEVFRDKTMDALNSLFLGKVNLMSDDGKKHAKEKIRASLNSALPHGQVEEVFIQNLVVQ